MQIKSAQVAFVRHGQSEGNIGNIWEGARTDSELSELGREQSEVTGVYLSRFASGMQTIYASPLRRAVDTANIIANHVGVAVEIMSDLIEFDLGELEGKTSDEVFRAFPNINSLWGPDVETPIPGGESAASVAIRASGVFQHIAHRLSPGETSIVVSHQGTFTLGLATMLGDKTSFMEYQPSNCGVTWIAFKPTPEIVELDTIEHLSAAGFETTKWVTRE